MPSSESARLDAELGRSLELEVGQVATERDLWSLARISDGEVPPALRALLDGDRGGPALAALALIEPEPAERGAPAQVDPDLEDALWTRYAVAEDHEEWSALLLSIARLGGERSVERLAIDLATLPNEDDLRYRRGMTALGILCQRGHPLDEVARDAVAQGLEATAPEVQGAAAFALRRCVAPSAELFSAAGEREVLVGRLGRLVDSESPAAARPAWQAFAALGEQPPNVPPSILGETPPGWQVEVEAVRALATSAEGRRLLLERLATADMERFDGPRAHVLLVALQILRPIVGGGDPEVAARLVSIGERLEDARAVAEGRFGRAMELARCELEVLRAIDGGRLERLRGCVEPDSDLPAEHADVLAVEALLNMGKAMPREERVRQLLEAAQDPRPRVAAAGLWALAEVEDPAVMPALRDALDSDDVSVFTAAAGAVAARSKDSGKRDPEAIPALRRALARLDNATAVEARIAAVDALASLARAPRSSVTPGEAGADPEQAADRAVYAGKPSGTEQTASWLGEVMLPLAEDGSVAVRRAAREALLGEDDLLVEFDGRRAEAAPAADFGPILRERVDDPSLRGARGLRFITAAGTFEIHFAGVEAPINQANLVALARDGFFDGLRFQRVVPGFVVQGGDPRGDGYGGPGYLVPCEWSNLAYERGTVGMALAGKDTGGSQIFVAQSRQPHLDARFTVVGQVELGLDVVDELLPYDRIEKVEVLD